MRYDRPELGERLAADYVLGLMPARARQRFDRALADNATLAARVAAWSELLTPLDAVTAGETPPTHVWRKIERRVGSGLRQAGRPRATIRIFWRAFAATAFAACVALAVAIALDPTPLPKFVEDLAGEIGLPGSAAPAAHHPAVIGLSAIDIGISERERPRWIRDALLLTNSALPIIADLPPHSR